MTNTVKIPKEEIIAAAYDILKNHGLEAISTRNIATKLGCSIKPIYRAFRDMESLLEAVHEKAMQKYTKILLAEISGETKIKSIGLNYIRFAKEYPELFKFIFFNDRQENTSIADHSLDTNKAHVVKLIKEGYGITDDKRAEDLYIKLGIFCNGVAAMIISKSTKFTDADIDRLISEVSIKLVSD
ncbi:MAG: TetR/AcrR family transcriptional regulator [Firmicutes bacterium]|nr:TetR/AcrR family transcriptional regulator [Bacillota bacterium]